MSWTNQVSYSEGDEVFVFADRPSAVTKIRETVTDAGLGVHDWADQDPDYSDSYGLITEGYLLVEYEGNVKYRLVEVTMPLSQRMLAAADTLEEVSTIYEAHDKTWSPWTAGQLRNEAQHV